MKDKKPQQIIEVSQIIRFGERLKQAMNGESNNAFAKRCGWSEKVIRNYINGETYPDIDRLATIANNTGRSVTWLITGHDNDTDSDYKTSQKESKEPTQQQRERWLDILERMTPNEIDIAINNINRRGIDMLLITGSDSRGQSNVSDSEPSMTSIKTAELIELLSSDDKKYIFSLIAEAQRRSLMTDDNEQQRTG